MSPSRSRFLFISLCLFFLCGGATRLDSPATSCGIGVPLVKYSAGREYCTNDASHADQNTDQHTNQNADQNTDWTHQHADKYVDQHTHKNTNKVIR